MHQAIRLLAFKLLIILSLLVQSAHAKEKQLNLVFAGNMPDISAKAPATYTDLASILATQRAKSAPTVFAFAGGSLGPSPLASLDRGSHIIDILNSLEPDLMTLTKREFSYFEDQLTLRTYEAAFPILATNLFDPMLNTNLEGILTNLMIEKDDIKLGFMAILNESVVEEYLLQRAKVFEPQQIINRQIALLNQSGADLIILVYSEQRDYIHQLIAQNKIDFALRISPTDEIVSPKGMSKNVVTISDNHPIKVLNLSWQDDKANKELVISTEEFELPQPANSSETSLLLTEYQHRLDRLLTQKIGVFGNLVDTSRPLVRTQEIPFGNFVADTIREYAKTDIGLINGGNIRGNRRYEAGTAITRRDIMSELPFRTHISQVKLKGEQLKQVLEHSVSEVEAEKGRFLQVSGLTFSFSTEQPIGQRTQKIKVNGQALDLNKTYSVGTSNYLIAGGDEFAMFLPEKTILPEKTSPLLSDLVIRAIQQQKTINLLPENRIQRLNQ